MLVYSHKYELSAMINYYRHRSKNILLRQFSYDITEKDAIYLLNIEQKIFNSENCKFITIAYFKPGYSIVNKNTISLFADFSNLYQSKYQHSYFVGLVGINKLILNVFIRLAAKNFPREIFENLDEIEKILHFSYPQDFDEIFLESKQTLIN